MAASKAQDNVTSQIITWGSDKYIYDADGNLTTVSGSGTLSATYDLQNRPITLALNGASTAYTYDGIGNRVQSAGSQTHNYHYDHMGRLLFETDSRGNVTAYYIYTGVRLVGVKESGASYFYRFDKTGDTVAVTNTSGFVVNLYTYTPFGSLSNSIGTLYNPFTFVGEFGVISEGGNVYFMKNRYYDATTGRFMSKDPIGLKGGTNIYVYTINNPVNWIDPFGLDLTASQQAAVQSAAQDWTNSNVPYAFGHSTKKGADCSGAVSGIYNQAGINIGRLTSQSFQNSPLFSPATGDLQIGDVGVYPGHVVIYGGDTGPNSDVWSASHTGGPVFGPANSSWYGEPTWYRYKGK